MFWKQVHTKLKVCFIEDNKLSPHTCEDTTRSIVKGGRLKYCIMFPKQDHWGKTDEACLNILELAPPKNMTYLSDWWTCLVDFELTRTPPQWRTITKRPFQPQNYGLAMEFTSFTEKREREILDCLSQNSKRFSKMDNAQKSWLMIPVS